MVNHGQIYIGSPHPMHIHTMPSLLRRQLCVFLYRLALLLSESESASDPVQHVGAKSLRSVGDTKRYVPCV